MVNSDDLAGLAICGHEVVKHGRKIARAAADIENLRTRVEEWKEVLGGVRMLGPPFRQGLAEQVRRRVLEGADHVRGRNGRSVADGSGCRTRCEASILLQMMITNATGVSPGKRRL